jgi:hypothetical protein
MFSNIFTGVASLVTGKIVAIPCKNNWKDKAFEYNFHTICRYLNLVKIEG